MFARLRQLCGFGLLLLLLGCIRETTFPDVVLITLDTTRADALGCYGGSPGATPHLDALAERATLFANASAQAAVTPVSHASILTGLNPYTHGLRVMHGRTENRLADAVRTLPEVLRAAGYRTAAFTSAFPVTRRFGLAQGFDLFEESFVTDAGRVGADGALNTGTSQRRADETTDLALAWLARDPGAEPRFVWVHYFDPHDVFVLPPDEVIEPHRPLPRLERSQLRALYAIEVHYMDEQIGRLLTGVDPDRTVVAVIADHGEGHGDHEWWTHGLLYQEQIRVPLIVRIPGIAEGVRVESLVRSIDLAPTLLEAVGVPRARWPTMEGRSLLPQLRGEPVVDEPAYADSLSLMAYHFTKNVVDRRDDMLFSLTAGGWKYIHHGLRPGESELYDLVADPGETRNRIADAPGQLARMRALFAKADFVPERLPVLEQMDPEDAERLRSLGYAQ